jgi:hypothetical protein
MDHRHRHVELLVAGVGIDDLLPALPADAIDRPAVERAESDLSRRAVDAKGLQRVSAARA